MRRKTTLKDVASSMAPPREMVEAGELMANGNFEQAAALYSKVISKDSQNWQVNASSNSL
jgi:hypothetical protein